MLTLRQLSAIFSVAVTLAACGGGGGGSGSAPPAIPSGLSYSGTAHLLVGTTVHVSPTVTGSVTSYTISPALQDGLVLNASTGVISGKPSATMASTQYTVTASNSSGSDQTTITIQVFDSPPSGLSYSQTQEAAVAWPYSNSPTITGVVFAYAVSPALPSGLYIDENTGVISGTPTALAPLTNYTVTATNDGGSTTVIVPIQVRDTYVSFCMNTGPCSSTPYSELLVVQAGSYYGLASVSVNVGGKFIGTQTTGYTFNLAGLFAPGTYPVVITTVTNTGVTETYTGSITIIIPPVVTLAPATGTIAYGSLSISGTATTETSGNFTVTVSLNGNTIYTTTKSPWSITYSLSGVPSGLATIGATATDSSGASTSVYTGVVVTTNSAEAALVPLFYTPDIVAVDGNDYVYVDGTGSVHFSSPAGDVILQGAYGESTLPTITGTPYLTNWQVFNNQPFASGNLGSSSSATQVYTWSATSGAATSLTMAANETSGSLIAVHDGWAMWFNQSSSPGALEFFNLSSQQVTVLPNAASLNYNGDGNFFLSSGELQAFYSASDSAGYSQVFQWSQAAGSASQVSSGLNNSGVVTDGVDAIWSNTANSTTAPNLVAYNISTATTTVLATDFYVSGLATGIYTLANGNLGFAEYVSLLEDGEGVTISVWSEATGVTQPIYFQNGGNAGGLVGVGNGYVIFKDGQGLKAFNIATGVANLIVEGGSSYRTSALISGNTLYFAPIVYAYTNEGEFAGGYWYREVLP